SYFAVQGLTIPTLNPDFAKLTKGESDKVGPQSEILRHGRRNEVPRGEDQQIPDSGVDVGVEDDEFFEHSDIDKLPTTGSNIHSTTLERDGGKNLRRNLLGRIASCYWVIMMPAPGGGGGGGDESEDYKKYGKKKSKKMKSKY
ncbi:hypothetical protein L9F63_024452, partial [Diploptera punctata]